MSDEKLDLILTVVSDIKLKVDKLDTKVDNLEVRFDRLETKVDNLEVRFDRLETKVDNLEVRFDRLETKVDNLESEFTDFKERVIESFAQVNNRFALLEKQMLAIGVEIKQEIKQEIKAVGAKIERLEKQVIYDRGETLENKSELREIDDRLTKIENHIGL
ncbi:MAG: hypothetical protein LH472_14055 [Pyrinomonadaceae bacterium]|nr:hypothetical protein [Pyrinomonadaceae bacterium]